MALAVELENDTPDGGRIDLANANAIAGRPAAILFLAALQMIEHHRAVAGPGVTTELKCCLGVIVVSQLITAKLGVAPHGNFGLAILDPLLAPLILILQVLLKVPAVVVEVA